VLRLWLTRRWLLGTVAAVVFGVACFYLGLWQWHRHVEQRTKVAAIAGNYDATPKPFTPALVDQPLTPERQWTHVTLTGTYAAGSDLLVRNRTLNSTVGFEVLTPMQVDGLTILVDRGWVPNGANAEAIPPVDPPPTGSVEVTGWLRTGEVSLGRDVPRPQLVSINIADAHAQVPSLSNVDAYVVLGSQQPATVDAGHPLQPLPRPEEDLGPHQAYAYQWWLFMPGGLLFVFFAIRRQAAALRESQSGPEAVPPRPKKVRIWDEEDA
jgi:cytochrome oxidase assembly protein ShyY1